MICTRAAANAAGSSASANLRHSRRLSPAGIRVVPVIRAADHRTSVATSIVKATPGGTTTKKQPFREGLGDPPLQYGAKHVSRDDMGATGSNWLVRCALASTAVCVTTHSDLEGLR